MSEQNGQNKVAVFFDYENIVYSLRNRFEQKANFDALMTKCQEFGQIVVAKAYADWGLPYISPALTYALQSSGFDLEFVPTGATQANSPRKNVADLYMAIQTMDALIKYPDVNTFILLTGDRDFMLLVNYLKRSGKRVIAIGVDGSSSYYLTQAVDDFYYYSEVEEGYEGKPRPIKGRPTNIYDALVQAVQIIREKGKNPRLTNIKPIMIELLGGFDEKEYKDEKGRNFQKFKDFVSEAQRRGFIKLISRNNRHEIYLPNESKSVRTPVHDDAEDEPIELANAFKLLMRAVRQAERDGKSRRSAAIKHRMSKLIPGFEETNVVDEDGEGFARFSDFLEAAVKAGHITLSGEGVRVEVQSAASKQASVEPAEEVELTPITGQAARSAFLEAMQAYNNYPTSFLSLAAHCHRHCANSNVVVDENEGRELMTEAVKIDLLAQIVKADGRRAYQLNAAAELIAQFLQQTAPEEVQAIVEDSDEEEEAVEEKPAKPTFSDNFEALAEAVRLIVAEGKDPVLPRAKSSLKALVPDFDEKDHKDHKGNTITKFKDFVLECERRGLVRLKVEGTVNRVFLAESSAEETQKEETPAIATTTVDLEDTIDAQEVEAMLAETKSGAIVVDEETQRQLVVDGLRAFDEYPAPFMTILAGVRKLRNERGIELNNNDLRDLLSEANRSRLLTDVSKKGQRPTLYSFTDDEALIRLFIAQEEAPPEAVTEHVEMVEKEILQKPSAAKPEPVVEAPQAAITVSYHELRRMIVSTLRDYDKFPAQFTQIWNEIMAVRERNNVNATDRELRELINEATRSNILPIISPYGTRPRLYELTKDEDAISAYVGEPSTRETKAEDAAVEEAAESPTETEAVAEEAMTSPFDLLVQAVESLQADGKSTGLSTVKRRMRRLDDAFDEKKLDGANGKPYKRFSDFVQDAAQSGYVTTEGKGRNRRVMLVESADENAESADAKPQAQPVTDSPIEEETAQPAEEQESEEATVESAPVSAMDEPEVAATDSAEVTQEIWSPADIVEETPAPVATSVGEEEAANETPESLPKETETDVEADTSEMPEAAWTPAEASEPPTVMNPVAATKEEPEIQGEANVTESEAVQEAVANIEPVQTADADSGTPTAEKKPLIAGFELIAQAVNDAVEAGRSQRLTAIRARMVKITPAFEARDLHDENGKNFRSFSAFAKAAEQAGYISLTGKGLQIQAHPK